MLQHNSPGMTIIVGLGNPGVEYTTTRHNAGFLCVDALADTWSCNQWKYSRACHAHIAKGTVADSPTPILLCKPDTYMNRSGDAVQALLKHYPISNLQNLIIIHDDVDILFGEIKYQYNRGPAGHHGVESIIHVLNTRAFSRIRIGITSQARRAADIVLRSFSQSEQALLPGIFAAIELHIRTTFLSPKTRDR